MSLSRGDSRECSRCDSTIVYTYDAPLSLVFRVDDDDEPDQSVYETVTRSLCRACKDDLLDWIDGDFTRGDAVDLPNVVRVVEGLRMTGQDLEELADRLEDEVELR